LPIDRVRNQLREKGEHGMMAMCKLQKDLYDVPAHSAGAGRMSWGPQDRLMHRTCEKPAREVGGPWARIHRPSILIGGLLCLLLASTAGAEEPRLKNITLSSTENRMVVSLRVEEAFTPEMIKAIHEGAVTEFTFFLRLYRDRRMWLDQKLISLNLTHSLTYNPVRGVYRIYRSWAREKRIETRSWREARELMTHIVRSDLLPLAQMKKGEGYELRAKAELSKITLPYNLRYVFYFVSFWDFETKWHAVVFIY
jgi:hypothetical protein